MSDTDETPPSARSRPRRWFSWIWIAPLLAVGIVIWLAIRALAERGPMITLSFRDAEGIQAGDTPNMPGRSFTLRTDDLGSLTGGSPISYRGVPVGEVEGFQLDASGKQINIYAFIRAPYEQFVP